MQFIGMIKKLNANLYFLISETLETITLIWQK